MNASSDVKDDHAENSGTDLLLSAQLDFLIAADRLKRVERKTSILDGTRKENSAEHSWHLMLTAMVLAQHANEPVDLFKVMQMIALHELGEIDTGDTFHFHKSAVSDMAERNAVRALFATLPDEQARYFMALWEEFEDADTPEAKFARALDRIWPVIQNHTNGGGSWTEFGITADQVSDRNRHIDAGSNALWKVISSLILDAKETGILL